MCPERRGVASEVTVTKLTLEALHDQFTMRPVVVFENVHDCLKRHVANNTRESTWRVAELTLVTFEPRS